MPKIKDKPKSERPREKFLKKGSDALSKSDLLAIVLGNGIKGKNVQELALQIIKKYGNKFLDATIEELKSIEGIGTTKALQIVSAISLFKRFYEEEAGKEIIIRDYKDVLSLTYDLRDKKKEYLVCFYLNAKNILIKKEIISIGLINKSLIHPREVFNPAINLNSAGIILVHNHPSGNPQPSENDEEVMERIVQAGELVGIPVLDFIIVGNKDYYSFHKKIKNYERNAEYADYVAEGIQLTLFDLFGAENSISSIDIETANKNNAYHENPTKKIEPTISEVHFSNIAVKTHTAFVSFQAQNRRYLGNKYKLLGFIEDIVSEKCNGLKSFCDIFAGTGVVGERFNKPEIKIISNDFLFSNYACLKAFLGTNLKSQRNFRGAGSESEATIFNDITEKIDYLNNLRTEDDNYFSEHFGNTYFSLENARKIGTVREEIDKIAITEEEKNVLLCSLIYAVDKVANTVGHYDAFRKDLDMLQPLKLLIPAINFYNNNNNEIYKEDANILIRKITCDVLYIDPPYNSRQYSDAYHLLENLAEWKKPGVEGVAKKMNRSHIKSLYCLKNAKRAFEDLIINADCKHILLSYNNTGESKDGRSNARIDDNEIMLILKNKGEIEIFERNYKAFTTGKSASNGNIERIFYCKVR